MWVGLLISYATNANFATSVFCRILRLDAECTFPPPDPLPPLRGRRGSGYASPCIFRVEGNFSSPASPARRGEAMSGGHRGKGAGWYTRLQAAKETYPTTFFTPCGRCRVLLPPPAPSPLCEGGGGVVTHLLAFSESKVTSVPPPLLQRGEGVRGRDGTLGFKPQKKHTLLLSLPLAADAEYSSRPLPPPPSTREAGEFGAFDAYSHNYCPLPWRLSNKSS